ncbi:MAG: hypothetical protein ACQEUG_15745 [Pseudomonadota bacterium]
MPFGATAQLPRAIPFSLEYYLKLVGTTGRCQRPKQLERPNIVPEAFFAASTTLLKRFGSAVGTLASLSACCAGRQARHLRGMRAARERCER